MFFTKLFLNCYFKTWFNLSKNIEESFRGIRALFLDYIFLNQFRGEGWEVNLLVRAPIRFKHLLSIIFLSIADFFPTFKRLLPQYGMGAIVIAYILFYFVND